MIRIERQFLVQLNYKSGITVEMWFSQFKFSKDSSGAKVNFLSASRIDRPMFFNVDEIESVFQKAARRRIRFGRKQ
jgi:hypothetical protein